MSNKARELRMENGTATSVLAEVINCTVPTYYKKEKGDLRFSLQEARSLAVYWGMSIEELFFDDSIDLEMK